MKRAYGAWLWCIAMAFSLNAQSVSPLFQVMTTNSLINRPEVFRAMQDSLDIEFGKNQTPGLHLEGLQNVMEDIRGRIIGIFSELKATSSENDSVLTVILFKDTLKLTESDIDTGFLIMRSKLSECIYQNMKTILNSKGKPSVANAFISTLLKEISQSNLVLGMPVASNGNDALKNLSNVLAGIIIKPLKDLKEKAGAKITFAKIAEQFNTSVDLIRNEMINALNAVENQLSDVISDVSNKLIALNAGAGITQGTGSFSGGLYITAYSKQNWQMSLYANGQLNRSDSTKPGESLAGFHFRCAFKQVQGDLLMAGLFKDEKSEFFESGEIGLGISMNLYGIIAGMAYYGLFSDSAPFHTIGISLQPSKPGSPGFLIGAQQKDNKWQPIIQTSFPIYPVAN